MTVEIVRSGENISIGPGQLWIAPASAPEPTVSIGAPGASFVDLGWTEEGNTFTYDREIEHVYVPGHVHPIRSDVVKVTSSVSFMFAEMTWRNLNIAYGKWGGDVNQPGVLEPNENPYDDLRVMLVFDDAHGFRWIYRRCVNRGALEMAYKKAPDKTVIPVEFVLEKPADALPFKVIPAMSFLVTNDGDYLVTNDGDYLVVP
jgi:hypothetical protein